MMYTTAGLFILNSEMNLPTVRYCKNDLLKIAIDFESIDLINGFESLLTRIARKRNLVLRLKKTDRTTADDETMKFRKTGNYVCEQCYSTL